MTSPPFLRARLSGMMFLFYFALGAWAVTLSTYLMSSPLRGGLFFSTNQVGWIYSTFALGGMAAPLFVGLLADRLFAAQRVLGISQLLCGVFLAGAAVWCDRNAPTVDAVFRSTAAAELVDGAPVLDRLPPPGTAFSEPVRDALDRVKDHPDVRSAAASTFLPLFGLMLGYCFSLQIGITLITVIVLRNLPDAGRGFSWMRMFGTVGWIVAGFVIGGVLVPLSPDPLWLGAGASTTLGLFAFTLPNTPPRGHGRSLAEAVGLPALKLLANRSFAVFIGVAFLASAMNQFYGVYAHRYLTEYNVPRPELVLTLGQAVEVAVMFAIPLLNPKKYLKLLMTLGLLGWVLRGVAMAVGWLPGVIAVGVPMHGWSFAFFFVTAATFLDRVAPKHLRASSQGIVSFVASGISVWAGNLLAAAVVDEYRVGTTIQWGPVWMVPLIGCTLATIAFILLFRPPEYEASDTQTPPASTAVT